MECGLVRMMSLSDKRWLWPPVKHSPSAALIIDQAEAPPEGFTREESITLTASSLSSFDIKHSTLKHTWTFISFWLRFRFYITEGHNHNLAFKNYFHISSALSNLELGALQLSQT